MKIVIIEGARGTGKTTLVGAVRKKLTETVAINFTGMKGDNRETALNIFRHYDNFLIYLSNEQYDESKINYIFDRFFFSELVYSSLYKTYDFRKYYHNLKSTLESWSKSKTNFEVVYVQLVASEETLKNRLLARNCNGDKEKLFSRVEESVQESLKQQEEYNKLYYDIQLEKYQYEVTDDNFNQVVNEIVGMYGE